MILEHALLPVRPGLERDFEAAFAQAEPIIAAMPGCLRVDLSRCLERPHHFYDPFPTVEHYEEVGAP